MRIKRVYRKRNKEFWGIDKPRRFYVYLREMKAGPGIVAKVIDIEDARTMYQTIAQTKSYVEKHGGADKVVCPF